MKNKLRHPLHTRGACAAGIWLESLNAGPWAVNTYTDPTCPSAHLIANVGSQVGCPPTLYRPRRLTDPRAQ